MRNWKNYKVWQLAHSFLLEIYGVTPKFPISEQYNLTAQLRRATLSIPTNIVEGAGRKSDAEFRKFLIIAQGSANEVEYLILVAKDLKYLEEEKYKELTEKVIVIKKMNRKLISTLS